MSLVRSMYRQPRFVQRLARRRLNLARAQRAARSVAEELEQRTLFAFNIGLSTGSNPSLNITASTSAGTTTFTPTANAFLNWHDVANAFAAGNDVVISGGSAGTQPGLIEDSTGFQFPDTGRHTLTIKTGTGPGLFGFVNLQRITFGGTEQSLVIDAFGSIDIGWLSGGSFASPTQMASATLISETGSIAAPLIAPFFAGPVEARTVALSASTGIGTAKFGALGTDATDLSARTNTGGIYISNSGDMNISGGVIPGVNGVQVISSGDILLNNQGDINIQTLGDTVSTPGNVSLTQSSGSILVAGDNGGGLDSPAAAIYSGGDASVFASKDLFIGDPAGFFMGDIVSGGNILVGCNGNLTINGGSQISALGTGTVTATARKNISVLNTGDLPGAEIATEGGAVTVTTGQTGILTLNSDGSAINHTIWTTRNGGNGNVTLNADHFILNASTDDILAGTGTVIVQPVLVVDEPIHLGDSADKELDLSDAEMGRISAGVLQIGSSSVKSSITFTGKITAHAGYSTLALVTGGDVIDSSNNEPDVAVTNLQITAGDVSLDTAVSNLSAQAPGKINISNSGNLNIYGVGVQGGFLPINITAMGAGSVLTVSSPVNCTTPGGPAANITLSADDMAINAPVHAAGIVTLQQGGTAARIIALGLDFPGFLGLSDTELDEVTASVLRIGRTDNAGTLVLAAPVTTHSGFGLLHLLTGDRVVSDFGASLAVTSLAVTAANSVDLFNVNDVSNFAAQVTNVGNFLGFKDGTNTLTIPSTSLDGVLGVTVNNSGLQLEADGMNIGAAVSSGSVTLNPFSFQHPIILGSKPSGALGLTNAELNKINARTVTVSNDSSSEGAPITITAPITAPPSWNLLQLLSDSGGISQNNGAPITVPSLDASSGGGVFLNDPGNKVTNLGGEVTNFGGFNFVNSTSFNVAAVDGGDGNGIESFGSPVNLTALGSGSSLNVNAHIFANGADITLVADQISVNNIINSEFFGVVTFEQGSTSPRDIDLGGGLTPGDLGLSDAELAKVVAKAVRIGRADNAGNITVTAPVTSHSGFPTLSLISGGSISDVSSADSVAAANLALRAGAGISLDTNVPTLAFNNASGAVRIANTGPLTIDSVDGLTASSNGGTTTNLSAASPVDFVANTTSAGTITVTTTETASETSTPLPTPDDNITVKGVITLQSTGGDVNLQSADGIAINGQVLAPAGNITLSSGIADSDHDGLMALNGALSTVGSITFNIPAGNSAALSGTAAAAQAIENGGGSLFVDGSLNSSITVNAGTLAGQGIITGAVDVVPGATLGTGHNRPGILSTGTATLSNPSTFSVRLSGTTPGNSAANYGQLDVNGDVNLNNATLAAALTFTPTATQTFTLIQASGNINGHFAQGSKIVLNGIMYAINYLPHSVVLAQPADLSVTVNGPASVNEGTAASYTYNVSNGGPGAAANVVLSAPIPAGAVFVSASFGGGFTLPASAYDPTTGTVNLANLAPGAGGTLTLKVDFPEENPGVTFAATIATTGTTDFNLANNSASVTTVVNDAPLTALGRTVSTTHGAKTFTDVTVASFSDSNLAATLSDFTATVNWGDQTSSAAQIVANNDGTFSVIASHTYKNARSKSYSLAIQIVDVGGSIANTTGTANLLA